MIHSSPSLRNGETSNCTWSYTPRAQQTDAEGKKEFETLEADEKHIIEVPVQNTVKFVLDLLIREGTASAVAGSPISVVGKKNSRDSTVVSEELDEENFSKDPAAGGDSDQSRALGTKVREAGVAALER